jgi:hypothetical protein
MTLKSLVGEKYGKLTILHEGEPLLAKNSYAIIRKWVCKCECGNTISVRQDSLRSGNTRSCGCLRKIGVKKGKNNSHEAKKQKEK